MDPESFVHSRYIILWACNVRSTNLHMWPFIKEAQDRGAKVVVIDPLRHRTAQSADWYIPIRPGTDGALALAMMHVIINEGLVDKDYVDQHTVGFEELAERVQQYPPDWAAQTSPASRPTTSSRWPGSTPPHSRRPSASASPSNATPAAARRCVPITSLPGPGRRMAQRRRRDPAACRCGPSPCSGARFSAPS